jgi:hypothetical protein
MIYIDRSPTAYGETASEGWDSYRAWSEENSSWKSIFSNTSTPGKNLYKFMGKKLVVSPGNKAISVIASNYHLTDNEALSAVKGDISVLFNNSPNMRRLTTADAAKMQKQIQDDYTSYKELFDIQEEVDTSISPTEMFSNGDLEDSGFDLIYDLGVMEKILFGSPSVGASGQPLSEAEGNIASFLDTIPAVDPATIPTVANANPGPVSITETTGTDANGKPKKQAEIKVGDKVLPTEIADADVCPTDNKLADASKNFDKNNPTKPNGGKPAGNGNDPSNGDGNAGDAGNQDNGAQTFTPENPIPPAKSDAKKIGFCGDVPANDASPAFASMDSEGGPAAGAGAFGFSVKVALCIKIEMIKEAAYDSSGSSCIKCEIEKINKALNSTLSQSMIPNKTTGNLMESATCKKSFGSLLDFKVHLVGSPLPAEPADDVIFGKNAIAEWNKFVEASKPYGFSKWDKSTAEEFALNYVGADITSDQLATDLSAIISANTAEAMKNIQANSIADEGMSMTLFSKPVLSQMNEMKGFFEMYKQNYEDVNSSIEKIKAKPCVP